MARERGRLVLSKRGKPQIEKEGKLFNLAHDELSHSIMKKLKDFVGAEVEFEWEGGQPKKIRLVGETFVPSQGSPSHTRPSGTNRQSQAQVHQTSRQRNDVRRDFHNPYNFIPAPPRTIDDPDLGDCRPVTQDRFHPDRITGRIRIRMEAVTPLLVPDPESCREQDNGHKIFSLLLDKDGRPLLPSSSVRGMLRSAYEAVTNSRFGRFPKKEHGRRLAYRMEAKEGLNLIPARIENGKVHLLTGTSGVGQQGKPNGPLYAAWLPRYSGSKDKKSTSKALRYPDDSLPQHGDEVVCWVEKIRHLKFTFWRVREVVKGNDLGLLKSQPPPSSPQKNAEPVQPTEMKKVHGWVCVTNANINRKHDERVFFCAGKPPGPFTLTEDLRQKWRELIRNYQEIHADELEQRRRRGQPFDAYLGSDPGQTAWSRHIYSQADLELRDGTLCYARLSQDGKKVDALFPVMISRDLYESSPWDLLDASLRPASRIEDLSPADRVFGWVLTDSEMRKGTPQPSAVRGLLRVGPVTCDSSPEDSVEAFPDHGLPLAILAAPKPQQAKFYVARSPQGEAQGDGLSKKEAGYSKGKGLRGRKVYPHHADLPKNHWENPLEDRTQGDSGPWQEYRRPQKDGQEQRDGQNRSITGWVKAGAQFHFDIHVMNLSTVELGALLWLLNLPENCFHRFGGGKPLGFGSVRLRMESCDLRAGEDLKRRYGSWSQPGTTDYPVEKAIGAFQEAVCRAYGLERFDDVPFIAAFLQASKGFEDGLPIHYPRTGANGRPGPPSPDGESFKWFVANENRNARFALGDLRNDPGLPILQPR